MSAEEFIYGMVEAIANNSLIEADNGDSILFSNVKDVYPFGNGLIVELEDGHEIRVKVTVE